MIAAMPGPQTPMPSSLRRHARWQRLASGGVPAMLVHPDWESARPAPVVLWMHGRTVEKELDPGRYLRWLRAGIATCTVDLPGHGERFEQALQHPEQAMEVVLRMLGEIDGIIDALRELDIFDLDRAGIGGMSAGGMAALARLCTEHPFCCASVEATSGSWRHRSHRPTFRDRSREGSPCDPIEPLDGWREIPLQVFHGRYDEWVPVESQQAFLDALGKRYRDPGLIEFIRYDRTGALYEHAGFGRMAADAKNRQSSFFARWLIADG